MNGEHLSPVYGAYRGLAFAELLRGSRLDSLRVLRASA